VEQRDGAIAAPIISVTVRDRSRSSGEEESANETGGEAGDATEPEADEGNEEEDEMEEGVFLVRNGEVIWTPVTLGITGEEYFEVLSGLAVGDTVVSGPYQTIRTLSDGDPVRIVGSSGEATSPQP
jgi:HlyD family secretion protein